jgi:potassium-transporting ATPase KdpC subunit
MASNIMRDLKGAIVATVVLTVIFGLGYPALMTGIAQLTFHNKANGSLITVNGKVVGSKLAAQGFTSAKYFHERPSATSPAYNAAATTFGNLGPTDPALATAVHQQITAILKLEGPYNAGLTVHDIPVDAVTTSGSGIDPEISPAYAQLQSARVAAVRKLPLTTVKQLIKKYTVGRSLGLFGEPGVNVLELNIALDKESGS